MKIIVIIEASHSQPGVFLQGIELVEDLVKNANFTDIIEVVVTNSKSTSDLLDRGFTVHLLELNIFDRLIRLLSATTVFPFIQKYLKLMSHFEKSLVKLGANFLVFATQSSTPSIISKTIFVSQIHDIAFIEYPEFSESSNYGEARIRTRYLEIVSKASSLVITESLSLRKSVIEMFHLDPNRVIAIPHSVPKDFLTLELERITSKSNFAALGNFYLYPAQFWEHKNHKVVVHAIKKLHESSHMAHVVFVGQDQGVLDSIEGLVNALNLQDYVHFAGFQSRSELFDLYKSCVALVMTTYFGPTNVPPLEAWLLGVPVIYSEHLSENLGESVIRVDVDSVDSVANGLQLAINETTRTRLISEGHMMLESLQNLRTTQIRALLGQMKKVSDRVLSFT